MIVSIKHKGLSLLWNKGDGSKLPADQIGKIKNILSRLDAAENVHDMSFGGSKLHPLKGTLFGFWSVTVKANWRIIFQFRDGEAHLIDYLDYH